MFMSQESWTFSAISSFPFSCIEVRKKYLVDYTAKYLALLDGVLCRTERLKEYRKTWHRPYQWLAMPLPCWTIQKACSIQQVCL